MKNAFIIWLHCISEKLNEEDSDLYELYYEVLVFFADMPISVKDIYGITYSCNLIQICFSYFFIH